MRETRSSGSVEGVMSNRDPYSDFDFQLRAELPDSLDRLNLGSIDTSNKLS